MIYKVISWDSAVSLYGGEIAHTDFLRFPRFPDSIWSQRLLPKCPLLSYFQRERRLRGAPIQTGFYAGCILLSVSSRTLQGLSACVLPLGLVVRVVPNRKRMIR